MKKYLSIILTIILSISVFSACSKEANSIEDTDKVTVVATVFPIYDWLREITKGAENVEVKMLIDSGVDLHNFQASADDVLTISNSDMFVYIGGESDEWVEDTLENVDTSKVQAVNLLNELGAAAKHEEEIEGVEHEHDEDEEHNHEDEYDEHIWLSLRNAQLLTEKLSQRLCEIDSNNSNLYKSNTDNYNAQLNELDKKYEAVANASSNKTIVCADRFPLRYLADDYSIKYYAAFSGCSAETEASFETISFLSQKLDENNLKYVLTIENPTHKIAQAVIDSSRSKAAQIISFDSMQSTTLIDANNSVTYLGVMSQNLDVFEKMLEQI